MATNTGKSSRKGSADNRTQSENPRTGDYTKRNGESSSNHKGEFMDVKKDGKPFKGVANTSVGRAATTRVATVCRNTEVAKEFDGRVARRKEITLDAFRTAYESHHKNR